MLEELVYLMEKGTPVGKGFGSFGDDKEGKLLDRLTDVLRRNQDYKESITLQREKVAMDNQDNIRRKKQLTQNISHELKTPVSSISGYLETILANDQIEREQIIYFVQKAYQQSGRLSGLLQDLSTITRMEEAADQIEKENCDLSTLVSEVVQDVRQTLLKGDCEIRCELPEGLIMEGNRALLQSVFHNLLENATLCPGFCN